jgi:hypothetical protein
MNNLKKSFIILLLSPYIINGAMPAIDNSEEILEEAVLLDDLSNAATLLQLDLARMKDQTQRKEGTFRYRSLKKMAELTEHMLRYYEPEYIATLFTETEPFRKHLNSYRRQVATINNLLQKSKGIFGSRSLQSQENINKEIQYLANILSSIVYKSNEISSKNAGLLLNENGY